MESKTRVQCWFRVLLSVAATILICELVQAYDPALAPWDGHQRPSNDRHDGGSSTSAQDRNEQVALRMDRQGRACMAKGDYERGLEYFQEAFDKAQLERDAKYYRRDIVWGKACIVGQQGVEAWQKGDYRDALRLFKEQQKLYDGPNVRNAIVRAEAVVEASEKHEREVSNQEALNKTTAEHIQQSVQTLAKTLNATPSRGGLDFMSAETAKHALEFGDPNIAQPALIKAPVQSLTKVEAEIQGVQESLQQLKRSTSLDADERREWEKRSADALRDSYVLGANVTMDVLAAYTERQIIKEEAELRRANDLLAGETDPNRREQLHAAFRALNDRKVELEQTKGGIEKAHDSVDILRTTQDMAYSEKQDESKNLLEAAWEACEKFKVLPEGSGQAKAIVDASYDITVQVLGVQRINALDANSEQYLKAVDVLSKRIKTLIKIKKAQGGTN